MFSTSGVKRARGVDSVVAVAVKAYGVFVFCQAIKGNQQKPARRDKFDANSHDVSETAPARDRQKKEKF